MLKKIIVTSVTKQVATFLVRNETEQNPIATFSLSSEEIRDSIREMTNALFAINDLHGE